MIVLRLLLITIVGLVVPSLAAVVPTDLEARQLKLGVGVLGPASCAPGSVVGIATPPLNILGRKICACVNVGRNLGGLVGISACPACGPASSPSCSDATCGCPCVTNASPNGSEQCQCNVGFSLNGAGACVSTCGPNSTRDANGQCVCDVGFEAGAGVGGSGCVKVCPPNSTRQANGTCQCKGGFNLLNQICVQVCGLNQVRNPTTGSCVCQVGFQAINGLVGCFSLCGLNSHKLADGTCVCNPGFTKNVLGLCLP